MSDWEEFQDITRDEVPPHYHVYRLETEYMNHSESRHSFQTLRIIEGENVLWKIGEGIKKERLITQKIHAERIEKKAIITYHFRKKVKFFCPFSQKWGDVDPALLI